MYGRRAKPDQRISCSVAGCEFNENLEYCALEGIRVEENEIGEDGSCESSMCASYKSIDS